MGAPNVTWTLSNPLEGRILPQPRADAADPDFWRDGAKPRPPSARFVQLASGLLSMRQDDALTLAFARSMETRLAKIYAVEFARYRALEFFAQSTEIEPGAREWSYKMIQRIGQAGLINEGNARDLPRISLGGQETQMPVVTYGAAYGFNIIDEQSASLAGIALETELAKATKEAIVAFAEQMYAIGLPGTDIVGVTNAPGVQIFPQLSIASGTWAAQIAAIAAATPTVPNAAVAVASTIATDLLSLMTAVSVNTNDMQEATDALLPTNLYNMLKNTVRSPGFTSDTLLTYVESVTGLRIRSWNILNNIGTLAGSPATVGGGAGALKTRIVVYDNDPDVVELMLAQPFVQLAPQLAGMEYTVPCYERSGGAKVVRPNGIAVMDGC